MFSQIGKHLAQVAGGRSGHGCIQRLPLSLSFYYFNFHFSFISLPIAHFRFSVNLSFTTFTFVIFNFIHSRTICEVAATPSHNDGLFGEILLMSRRRKDNHDIILLQPSKDKIPPIPGDIMNVVFSASSTIGEDLQDLLSPEYK